MNKEDTSTVRDENTTTSGVDEIETPEDYKKEKYIALYQARTILSKHGTMKERQICLNQLKRMKKLGKAAV